MEVQYKTPIYFLPFGNIYLGDYVMGSLPNKTHGLNEEQIHSVFAKC